MSFDIPTLDNDGRIQSPEVLAQIRRIAEGAQATNSNGGYMVSGPGRPDKPETTDGVLIDEGGEPIKVGAGTLYVSTDRRDGASVWVSYLGIRKAWTDDGVPIEVEQMKWQVVSGASDLLVVKIGEGFTPHPSDPSGLYLHSRPGFSTLEICFTGKKSELVDSAPFYIIYPNRVFTAGSSPLTDSATLIITVSEEPYGTTWAYFAGGFEVIFVDLRPIDDLGLEDDDLVTLRGRLAWEGDPDWPSDS